MGTVSVSREALQKIKIELGNFQTSMDSSTEHLKAHAEEVVVGVRNAIKKQQSLVTALEKTVTKLAGEIEQRQAQIINNNNKLNSLASSIASGKAQNSEMEQRIAQLQARKQRLISFASADSNNGGNDNSGQINAIENQIRECDSQRRRLNEQIASMQGQQNELNRKNDQLRDEKVRKEAELSTAKGELNKAREKNEKMKSAGTAVESRIGDLLGVVQHFKQTVTTTSSTSKSGIEKCLVAIDEYETVNLVGTMGAAQSGSDTANPAQTQQDMSDSQLDKLRSAAVAAAWKRERELVLNGRGTRDWTVAQQAELIQYGSVRGFEGQHMLSVSQFPQHAGNPDNIQFLTYEEHFYGAHESSWRNSTSGHFDPTSGEFQSQGGDAIPALPEIALTNRYDPAQYDLTLSLGRDFGYARREDVDESRIRHQGE